MQNGMRNKHYISNQAPLVVQPYTLLPLGAVKPDGWLKQQLVLMKNGITGNLDQLYEKVVGPRNGWLGGDGDGWERGPYWLDGLLPLAYLLDDDVLKSKVQPWIEWSLSNQTEDGYFGPVPFDSEPEPEPGLQRSKRRDWWPKMVMLKVLQQHYSATGDERVLQLMSRYFGYQRQQLPQRPLDYWSFWGNRRGGDNMMVVYWLYNITGDKALLDLAQLLNEQTYPYTDMFLKGEVLSSMRSFHCVNLAQGIKQPVVYYQQSGEPEHIEAVKKAFADIRKYHGQPQGMYGADESLHGTNPTQGSELCSTVEMMFSLETMLAITGDTQFADHLEQVAFNSLPTQISPDFKGRQYFQQANQVKLSAGYRSFYTDHFYDQVYGITTGYPCCTTNMHQAWPKFTRNLWYASSDNGLAALVYAPSRVTALVADGVEVTISEITKYPFSEDIRFSIETTNPVEFPIHLRIPAWCNNAVVTINEKNYQFDPDEDIVVVKRTWRDGDEMVLQLPMSFRTERWHENSASIQHGPLLYALRITDEWHYVESGEHPPGYYEVYPKSAWNYGLRQRAIREPGKFFKLQRLDGIAPQPWQPDTAPVQLETSAVRIPFWQMYNEMAGPLPASPVRGIENQTMEQITLIPYGCTNLRISEFPVVE
jgi:DUF1680 family protein